MTLFYKGFLGFFCDVLSIIAVLPLEMISHDGILFISIMKKFKDVLRMPRAEDEDYYEELRSFLIRSVHKGQKNIIHGKYFQFDIILDISLI